jgi:hypothetical protein
MGKVKRSKERASAVWEGVEWKLEIHSLKPP